VVKRIAFTLASFGSRSILELTMARITAALLAAVLASTKGFLAEAKEAKQDPLLDKDGYVAACPDYRTYSMYPQ
jgi:hypothetical protein